MITYEFRLRPNGEQEQKLWAALKATRELYNQGLQELVDHYQATGEHLNLFRHDKVHGTKQHPDLPAALVDTTLKRLHRSFENFFRGVKDGLKVGFPRFKSPNRWHTLPFRDATSNGISGGYFKAGKKLGGDIRFNLHRSIEGKVKFCRIVRRPSGWFLQAICEGVPKPLPATGKAIGLDFGITNLVADSDGDKVENPRNLQKSLKKLRKAQRRLARRKKGSKRRKKAARLVARHHERIANQRKDHLHKVARKYVNAYDTIVVEDLQVANMVRNGHLSRAIADASWSTLRSFIEVKAACAGRRFVAVPPRFTSQKCSGCGRMVEKSLSVRTHVCTCGYVDCRDVNAARNILILGLGSGLQGGETLVSPMN